MKQHVRILLGLAFMATVAACNKSDDVRPSGPKVHIAKPEQTIAVGQELELKPEFTQDAGISFRWTLNGEPVGDKATYTFKPRAHGDYKITFAASTPNGKDSAVYNITVLGQYANGVLVLNEGWFGTQSGSVWFYKYGADTLVPWVYHAVNPGKSLGGVMNTLQYGAIHNGKLYMVVKAGGPLVVTDASTLVETGRVENAVSGKAMSFVGLDATRGLIGADDGIYPINLTSLAIGSKIAGVSGAIGNMVKSGNYVFAHSNNDGMIVLNATTYAVAGKPFKATVGFVTGKNGRIYGAKDSLLMSVHPTTFVKDSVKMPFASVNPFGAWRSVQMASSTVNDHIFIIQPAANWQYGTKLYRYVVGNAASLAAPFITLPAGQYFYGSGVNYDHHTDELVITTINGPYTGSENRVLFYNAQTGALKKTIRYDGWYFPAMTVIQP
ncbi:DUF5074 domain-containing protein [Chitinophaga caseinilytica]|uniref:DUF5074 domain-containing protein n=1 Tax=Chitinophaga caseinilytica TaxID=2267521 RepID=UPI003C303B2C